jgi:hypothetical protein
LTAGEHDHLQPVAQSSEVTDGQDDDVHSGGYYQPWNVESKINSPPAAPAAPQYTPASSDRTDSNARKESVAAWLVLAVGILNIGYAGIAMAMYFASSTDKSVNGFVGIMYSMQILLGLGFVFHVDMARRLLMGLILLSLLLNIYTMFIAASLLAAITANPTILFGAVLAIIGKLIIPGAILAFLNSRSVKAVFGQ